MYNGIINVYKEAGYTSFDVVARLRGILCQRKIGHTGTLDPAATGVLPVCLGNGTGLVDMITDHDKVYKARVLLGTVTDTEDTTGKIISVRDIKEYGLYVTDTAETVGKTDMVDNVSEIAAKMDLEDTTEVDTDETKMTVAEEYAEEVKATKTHVMDIINNTVRSFVGGYDQIPPMYSAIRKDGKHLYELAREGKSIERAPRRVEIFSITVDEISLPYFTMTVHCKKGTYIRSLCRDIGEKLGCGACMDSLCRMRVGRFKIDDAVTLDKLEMLRDEGRLGDVVIPVDKMFCDIPAMVVSKKYATLIKNGNKIPVDGVIEEKKGNKISLDAITRDEGTENVKICSDSVRMYCDSIFYGIYRLNSKEKKYYPVKMFLPQGGED